MENRENKLKRDLLGDQDFNVMSYNSVTVITEMTSLHKIQLTSLYQTWTIQSISTISNSTNL